MCSCPIVFVRFLCELYCLDYPYLVQLQAFINVQGNLKANNSPQGVNYYAAFKQPLTEIIV